MSQLIDTYVYDGLGQRIKHSNNVLGTAETTDYDLLGRVTKSVSFGGQVTTYGYVEAGFDRHWIKTATNAAGRTSSIKSDMFDRVVEAQDFGGHITQYDYNLAGQLTHQDSTSGQALDYGYTVNGQLARLTDTGTGVTSSYAYDANGNRVLETYFRHTGTAPVYYQNARVTYDALNRVTLIDDASVDITYAYDANGNRRRVTSSYSQLATGSHSQADWYKYDSLDRFTLVKGTLSGGVIVKGATGIDIAYNARGDRMSATHGADGHVETYGYTADGYLKTVLTNGVLGATRTTDVLGRMTAYTEYQANGASVLSTRAVSYDGDNRVTNETDITYTASVTYTSQITNDYKLFDTGAGTYSGLEQGVLTHSRKVQSQSGSSTTTTTDTDYSYSWWTQGKVTQVDVKISPRTRTLRV